MNTESGKKTEPISVKKGKWQKLELAWDSVFEFFSLTKFGNHLKGEILDIKNKAPILFASMLLVICFLAWKGCEKDSHISRLETENKELKKTSDENIKTLNMAIGNLSSVIQSNSTSVQTLSRQLQEKEAENQRLIAERDKAQEEAEIAKNAVAGWMAVAQSCNTNTPLTERLDILTKWVAKNTESLTNVFDETLNKSNLLSVFESDRPTFKLIINGSKMVTNGSIISIKENRKLFLSVQNMSSVTAEQLTVGLYCTSCLTPTNLICGNSWTELPHLTQNMTNGDVMDATGKGHYWHWKATDSLGGGGGGYDIDALEISTNMTCPVVDVRFDVFANRSKIQTFDVTLKF